MSETYLYSADKTHESSQREEDKNQITCSTAVVRTGRKSMQECKVSVEVSMQGSL